MKKFMTEFKDKDKEKAASEAEDDPEPDINEQTLEVLNNISTISVPYLSRNSVSTPSFLHLLRTSTITSFVSSLSSL